MSYSDTDSDITHIFHLMKLSEKLAITPPLQGKNKKWFKYYAFGLISVIVLGTLYSLYGLVLFFSFFKTTNVVLRILLLIGMVVVNVTTILIAVSNGKTWSTFLDLFKYIDAKMNKEQITVHKKNLLRLELLLCHLLIFFLFGFNMVVEYSNYGWNFVRFFLIVYIGYYHLIITTLVLVQFASALRARFHRINNILVKTNDLHNIFNSFIPKYAPERINNLKSIKEVTDYYLLLSELVDMFNKLFGWQIFLMTEYIILVLLEVFNNLALAIDYTQVSKDAHHDFRTIIFLIALSVTFISFHARIILHCEAVNEESRNTLKISYNLQQTVEPNSEEKNEMIILSDIVNLVDAKTSAAGFYTVNRSLLSRVFSYLFSFTIVLIQFNRQ